MNELSNNELLTNPDKKQFIKDFKLPFPTYKSPYFEYYIELYKDIYDTKTKYNLLIDAVEILKNREDTLKSAYYKIMQKIISTINEVPAFKTLNESLSNKYDFKELPNEICIYNTNLHQLNKYSSDQKIKYNMPYNTKYYLSIDIIKANFNAVKFYNPEIVLNCETWETLIGKFTDIEYFIQSKIFRQMIFGNLKIKKIASIQKFLLAKLYSEIKNKMAVLGKCSTDEIIIATTHETINNDYNEILDIINNLPENMKNIWRIVPMCVHPLGNSQVFIKKSIINTNQINFNNMNNIKLEIKNIGKDFHSQAYKFYINQPICSYDLKGMKDNWLITYDNSYNFQSIITDTNNENNEKN